MHDTTQMLSVPPKASSIAETPKRTESIHPCKMRCQLICCELNGISRRTH
jgi:hypothetical protein